MVGHDLELHCTPEWLVQRQEHPLCAGAALGHAVFLSMSLCLVTPPPGSRANLDWCYLWHPHSLSEAASPSKVSTSHLLCEHPRSKLAETNWTSQLLPQSPGFWMKRKLSNFPQVVCTQVWPLCLYYRSSTSFTPSPKLPKSLGPKLSHTSPNPFLCPVDKAVPSFNRARPSLSLPGALGTTSPGCQPPSPPSQSWNLILCIPSTPRRDSLTNQWDIVEGNSFL